MEEKLKKLLEDPSFQEALSKTTSAEEASALLAQHGIQITPDELLAALTPPEGELDENALDGVAGGLFIGSRGFRGGRRGTQGHSRRAGRRAGRVGKNLTV